MQSAGTVPGNIPNVYTPPALMADLNGHQFDPTMSNFTSLPNPPHSAASSWLPSISMAQPQASPLNPNSASFNMPNTAADPLDLGNTFQQPFVPQDLWQMPMTLEWDWADMTGISIPGGAPYGGFDENMGMSNGGQQNGDAAGGGEAG
ncbi:hypothetical protein LTS18_009900 [Coniosporium uncinatum]|uniref:Uncharacterized protein n=1 Tax=Coniosporium uncinatum TaxID=93489 RepID=A0ACC3D0I3_9PEZI|nr:hypothetical protein LTS18_009900 [Coniosporium uncinatum]